MSKELLGHFASKFVNQKCNRPKQSLIRDRAIAIYQSVQSIQFPVAIWAFLDQLWIPGDRWPRSPTRHRRSLGEVVSVVVSEDAFVDASF